MVCAADFPESTADSWYRRGRLLACQGRYAEALAGFATAIRLRPRWTHAWVFRGVVLTQLGCYESAIETFQQAIALDPDRRAAWLFQGAVLNHLGRSTEAVACYVAAMKLPAEPEAEDYPMWLPTTTEPVASAN